MRIFIDFDSIEFVVNSFFIKGLHCFSELSGGVGVVGSNPAVPTKIKEGCPCWAPFFLS